MRIVGDIGIDNVRTWAFKEMLERLPERIRVLATKNFGLFRGNPHNPILGIHPLKDTNQGRHKKGSFAVSISRRYRAIYVVNNNV